MARGKKTTTEKKAEVISKKIEEPNISMRDLEKETGVNYRTAKDILDRDMPNVLTESHKTRDLIDVNLSILENGKKVIEDEIRRLANKEEGAIKINSMNDIKTLSATLEDAFKQNRLLEDKTTENVGLGAVKEIKINVGSE